MSSQAFPGFSFFASERELCRGFAWAQREALRNVAQDPVGGPCYEAALPGRDAYCMRDTAHQVLGAQLLGLSAHNWNMLSRFAAAADERRDFCSYWEIGFDGAPCPVDYTDDSSFWYNLPANFDVMDACWRMYQWTGDQRYLTSLDMDLFYRVTTHEYVRRWDRDRDGIPDRVTSEGRRGIATYDESDRNLEYRAAADLVSAQYLAYRAYAGILRLNGRPQAAQEMANKAASLQTRFESDWWNGAAGHFESVVYPDGRYGGEFIGSDAIWPVYSGIVQDEAKRRAQARYVYAQDATLCMEERTYVAESLWKAGEDEAALEVWLRSTAPEYDRREYPEVSFTALGSLVSGYMGLRPDAGARTLHTQSALLGGGWAEATNIPLWGGEISLMHEGREASTLENKTGSVLTWQCILGNGTCHEAQVPAGETVRFNL